MKKSFFNKSNPWNFVLLMKKTRAKKFKVRMFYHLQNLFWGVFGLGGFCRGVLVGGVYVRGFMSRGFLSGVFLF